MVDFLLNKYEEYVLGLTFLTFLVFPQLTLQLTNSKTEAEITTAKADLKKCVDGRAAIVLGAIKNACM